MNPMEIDLWSRIDGYAFDMVDAALPFSARLARDNNWSVNFAKRAIEEYKKFVFLAMTAGHPVTPSDEVDQVWHLHLLYTRSYWEDFNRILSSPLHHGPTLGGADEGRKFHTWYENTLCSYSKVFAVAPPVDIWPEPRRRFGNVAHFRRINVRTHWLISRPRLPRFTRLAVVTAPFLWLAGCDINTEADLSKAIPFFIVLVGFIWSLASAPDNSKKNKKKDDNNSGGGGCGAGSGDGGGCGGCGG